MVAKELIDMVFPYFMEDTLCEVLLNKWEEQWDLISVVSKENYWLGYVNKESLTNKKAYLCDVADKNLGQTINAKHYLYMVYPQIQKTKQNAFALVDADSHFAGTALRSNIGAVLQNMLTYRGEGAILVLEMHDTDFVLSKIAYLMEENNAKIIGMMIEENNHLFTVNLKLNTNDTQSIQRALVRNNIAISFIYNGNEDEVLREREMELALKHFDF